MVFMRKLASGMINMENGLRQKIRELEQKLSLSEKQNREMEVREDQARDMAQRIRVELEESEKLNIKLALQKGGQVDEFHLCAASELAAKFCREQCDEGPECEESGCNLFFVKAALGSSEKASKEEAEK